MNETLGLEQVSSIGSDSRTPDERLRCDDCGELIEPGEVFWRVGPDATFVKAFLTQGEYDYGAPGWVYMHVLCGLPRRKSR